VTGAPHIRTAFGLTVQSELELPSLTPGTGSRRVVLRVNPPVDRTEEGTGAPVFTADMERVWRSADGWLLRYEDPHREETWAMRVDSAGTAIDVERTEGIALPDLLQIVQSIGLAIVLQLRGVLLFHACAVDVGGQAILVLGAAGAGKSTMAAALVRHGFALLSDDISAIEVIDGAPVVHPGPPRLRLRPDAARATGWDPAALPRVFDTPLLGDKRHVELAVEGGSFCAEARRIAAIFVLERRTKDPAPLLRPLSSVEALATLRRNGYRDWLLEREQHAQRFPLIARLAHEVPVHSIRATDDHGALPGLIDSMLALVPVPAQY
jgi:HPr Serine kinase C-terminal domain